jgi:hypothetical protein
MMNHSTETAQETTGAVTAKQLLEVVRTAGTFGGCYMHGFAKHDRPSYSDAFIFEFRATSRTSFSGGKPEKTTQIHVPGYVSGGHTSEREAYQYEGKKEQRYCAAYRPLKGFWSLYAHEERLRDALELLPRDAEVSFHVSLDAGTNGYLVNADSQMGPYTERGLHTDHLYLVATFMQRGKRREMRVLLDTSTTPHNSARFGCPKHDHDKTGGG